jgi:hypothetical protein
MMTFAVLSIHYLLDDERYSPKSPRRIYGSFLHFLQHAVQILLIPDGGIGSYIKSIFFLRFIPWSSIDFPLNVKENKQVTPVL